MSQWTVFCMINMSPPKGENHFNKEKNLILSLVQPHVMSLHINPFAYKTTGASWLVCRLTEVLFDKPADQLHFWALSTSCPSLPFRWNCSICVISYTKLELELRFQRFTVWGRRSNEYRRAKYEVERHAPCRSASQQESEQKRRCVVKAAKGMGTFKTRLSSEG